MRGERRALLNGEGPRRLEAAVYPELTEAVAVATYKALLADAKAGRPHAPE